MTTPTPPPPADVDPLDRLTIAELDAGSRILKADMIVAITAKTMERAAALAILAWLLAKRVDPHAQLTTYRAMTINELVATLGITEAPAPDPNAPPLNTAAPDPTVVATVAKADPTGRARG